VAVFAEGPIGLCATAGAKLSGASLVIGIDSVPRRLEVARHMGADVVLNYKEQDVVAEIKRLTGGGVDVAIEALGTGSTFENALRCVRPGGTVSSLGVYSSHLALPLFLDRLEELDAAWAKRVAAESSKGRLLRYVVSATPRSVSAGLVAVPASSPMGAAGGTRNIVTFHSRRYRREPLVISGPGAGADVTAAGLLNDICSLSAV
jgi:threonine dehydrogenase-like Zn-dependent dehydrogenase